VKENLRRRLILLPCLRKDLFYFCFSYLGYFPYYLGYAGFSDPHGIFTPDLVFKAGLLSNFALSSLAVGYAFGSRISCGLVLVGRTLYPAQSCAWRQAIPLYIITLLSAVILVVYLNTLPGIPLFSALSGMVHEARQLRSSSGNSYAGPIPFHRFSFFWIYVLPVSSFALLALRKHIRRSRLLYDGLLVLAVGLSLFATVMNGEKGPLLTYCIGLFCVNRITATHSFKLPISRLFIIGVALTTSFALLVKLLYGYNATMAIELFLGRILRGGTETSLYYLHYYQTDQQGLFYGASWPNPGGFIPIHNINLSQMMMDNYFPLLKKQGIIGSMPSVYWADLLLNFGIPGIGVLGLVAGVTLAWFQRFFTKCISSPVTIAFYVAMILQITTIAQSGLWYLLMPFPFLTLIGAFMLVGQLRIIQIRSDSHDSFSFPVHSLRAITLG